MRAILLLAIVQSALAATLASAQVLASPLLPPTSAGVTANPTLAQMQTMMMMQSMGGRRGVQTGTSNPFVNGYGPPPTDSTTPPATPSTTRKGKKRTLEEIKAAVRARHEQERAANQKGKYSKKPNSVSSTK